MNLWITCCPFASAVRSYVLQMLPSLCQEQWWVFGVRVCMVCVGWGIMEVCLKAKQNAISWDVGDESVLCISITDLIWNKMACQNKFIMFIKQVHILTAI